MPGLFLRSNRITFNTGKLIKRCQSHESTKNIVPLRNRWHIDRTAKPGAIIPNHTISGDRTHVLRMKGSRMTNLFCDKTPVASHGLRNHALALLFVILLFGALPVAHTQESSSSEAGFNDTPSSANCRPRPDSSNTFATLGENTVLRVFHDAALSSSHLKAHENLTFRVAENLCQGNLLVIPRGALVHGVVIQSKKSRIIFGQARLLLQLTSIELGGVTYPLFTYPVEVVGKNKTHATEKKAAIGAAVGTATELGAVQYGEYSGQINENNAPTGSRILGNTAKLAGVGAGVGTTVSALSPGYYARIPAESVLKFTFNAPLFILPASAHEAANLDEFLNQAGPRLYPRPKSR